MKKINAAFAHFIVAKTKKETLAFFRIGITLFALVQVFVLLPDWQSFYGENGLLPWEISDALSTTQTPSLFSLFKILKPFGLSANGVLTAVTATYIFSLVALLTGFKTRLAGILAWLMHVILNTTGHFIAYGVETFTHIALFYCAVLPVGCCWSVDAYLKPQIIPPYFITLSIRLIQLHLAVMYVACGVEKAFGQQWWTGEAIWIALQQDQFHHLNIDWMAHYPIVPKLLCWSTLLVETLYPVAIFYSRTKKFWLLGIINMHLFIAVFLGLHLFGALMIILNITVFGQHCFPKIFTFKKGNFLQLFYALNRKTFLKPFM